MDKQYDWTYTTAYKGTLSDHWTAGYALSPGPRSVLSLLRVYTTQPILPLAPLEQVSDTEEPIDLELLKQPEKILFHDHVHLMGDDFGDNGSVLLDLRIVSRLHLWAVLLSTGMHTGRMTTQTFAGHVAVLNDLSSKFFPPLFDRATLARHAQLLSHPPAAFCSCG
jgi:hypothetical protein